MARSRNIKPSFFTNDALAECSILTRLLFVGLWTIADREGRLEDRPKKIKAEILPYDDGNCDQLLQELADRGFIARYQISDSKYIQILNFSKHQNPHPKEQASIIPAIGAIEPAAKINCKAAASADLSHAKPGPFPHPLALTPPLPPSPSGSLPIGNGEGKEAPPWPGTERVLTDTGFQEARKCAPGWDIYNLCRIYDDGIRKGEREAPRNTDRAFPAWCAKYTKGKSLTA